MYFHKKTHSAEWTCDDCDIAFNRKWNLKRHLIDIHGLHDNDLDNETGDTNESNANEKDSEDDESDSDDHTTVRTNKFALLADE